jgi:hypothetical protein
MNNPNNLRKSMYGNTISLPLQPQTELSSGPNEITPSLPFIPRSNMTLIYSNADPDPEGSETFGRIRIRSGTEINVSDPDSDPEPKLDPKKI